MKRTTKFVLSVLTTSCVLLLSASARATPGFPGAIASHLGLASSPPCSLCHNGATARGTVTTPFGKSMMGRGLQAYDEAALRTALDALMAANKDSDGDTQGDIAELKAGTSPNEGSGAPGAPGAPGATETVTPEYGCSSAPSSPTPLLAPGLGMLGLALLRRSRSRRASATQR